MRVEKIMDGCGEAERDLVVGELKDLLWKEVWRENIDLPRVRVEAERLPDGRFRISAEIKRWKTREK